MNENLCIIIDAMTLLESVQKLCDTLSKIKSIDESVSNELMNNFDALNDLLIKMNQSYSKRSLKPYKCLKCNQTNPKMFNRKKTECVPCMSKAAYEIIKDKINNGKERNIAARISRGHCSKCELKVTRENAQMFDWDHRNPKEKTYLISRMNRKSDELFYSEIEKCDLLCRNCHAMRTMQQFNANELQKRRTKDKI